VSERASARASSTIAPVKGPVGIVGAGYVGLPLACVFADAGHRIVLVDSNPEKIEMVKRGESYIRDVPADELRRHVEAGAIKATSDYDALKETEAILIALQTPLSPQREPDLSIVLGAVEDLAGRLQKGQLVVLESTTYPGTTRERLLPLLERHGLRVGEDFNLAFSPERVDPGREDWTTQNTPKIVGGITPACTERAVELYSRAIETVHAVSSPEAAELTKLLENIFRSVNIALVNELAQLCDRMSIDVWEVVGAAATKPFGFMSFQPGPGLGGHCMPIDPFYLTWKAREYDFYTEFIELAGKVNENMPWWCLGKIARALNSHERALKGSRVLLLGVAYKSDIDDTRESPALKLIELLQAEGAEVSYHDAFVPELPEHGLTSVPLDVKKVDCAVIVTAHSGIDYDELVAQAPLVVDLRNATGQNGTGNGKVWKL
jgi:UDP-N-acetyl-D-glucosamine dehydrogenase